MAQSKAAKSGPERFAILRFENLSADPAADWVGRALPEILSTELSGAPGLSVIPAAQMHGFDRSLGARPVSAPGISTERTDALAAGANRLGYGDYSVRGGRLSARLTIEDPQTGTMTKVISASAGADDVFAAATNLARQISTQLAPYPTHSVECVKEYAKALESHNFSDTTTSLNRAIAADAAFGPAYRMLAELTAQHGDRPGAIAVLDHALSQGGVIAPVERARIVVEAANLGGDAAAKQAALAALAKLEPGNPRTWQTLAEVAITRHDYKQSEDAYRRALELEPQNANLLNQLGYAAAWAGDFDNGINALRRYQQLRPNDPNALDSLGDLNFLAGRFPQAEELYLQAYKKDPNFLPTGPGGDLFKAAMARIMTGDIAGADDLDKKYVDARAAAHDSNAPFRELEWQWLTGRRRQAYAGLQSLAENFEHDSHKPEASHAYAEMSIWKLMSGDRASAAALAQKAAALATQATAAPAVISRFLSQPSASAAEWQSRAERFIPNPAQSAVKDEMLAYALLLDNKVKEATAPLQRIYAASGIANNEGLPVLLAWAELQNGNAGAAAQFLKFNPIPPSAGVGTFMCLYFPRIFELRGEVAAKTGSAESAKQDLELYRKLSGEAGQAHGLP